ncbi:MAG: Holliday junction branch migration protein RuvA [Bdellovibrio sp.]|nr:Holliday junction branch migration protein RuvA [Bdellovibrio sp.]
MIGYLQGEILENQDGKLTVGIGEKRTAGLVGYAVSVPQNAGYPLLPVGSNVELFVYTHVREDSLDLYGFSTKFEKTVFLLLLTVNGIGPKSALTLLSAAEPRALVEAITQGDQGFLTRLPGIGKKTAERVLVELKDVLQKKIDAGVFGNLGAVHGSTVGGGELSQNQSASRSLESGISPLSNTRVIQDARSALLGLGYRDAEVDQFLRRALTQLEAPPQKVEDLIKTALRQMV